MTSGEEKNLQNAADITEKSGDRSIIELYQTELKRLYAFAARYQAALPVDDALPENAKRRAIAGAIKEVLADNKTINSAEQGREIISRINEILSGGGKIDSDDSFDINEVLNPGELDLESLCKELGVMD